MEKKRAGSILIVDDDAQVLDSSSLLLREYGYDVVAAGSAEEALALLKDVAADVIISDIVMPVVSGIELLDQVRSLMPDTPIILMTAYADIGKAIVAIQKGAFDFIIKPYRPELLISSIEKAIRYHSLVRMEREYRLLLEEFNQEVETLVSERTMSLMALAMADKIRNPAAVIGLTCKRIIDRAGLPDELQENFRAILAESGKLDAMVREFQSLLKSRQSMFAYDKLGDAVESAMSVVRGEAAQKKVEIVVRPAASPVKINMRKNLFRIAVSHVLRNAIEATREGGRITVNEAVEGEHAVIEISDTGGGIRPEDLGRIFEPMFSTKQQQFGMGLALVRQIIAEHLGEISVQSVFGEGTTMRIQLPLRWKEEEYFRRLDSTSTLT